MMLKYYHVYAKATCPWCVEAINLLHETGNEFVLTLVENSAEFYHGVKKRYDHQTVPMVVEIDINGKENFIGGYTDLKEYFTDILDADIEENTEVSPNLSE